MIGRYLSVAALTFRVALTDIAVLAL